MSLVDAMERRGYAFRRHLAEESWTRRKLTVVDLTDAQRRALVSGGPKALTRRLESDGLWSFPASDIEKPIPVRREVVLAGGRSGRGYIVAPDAACAAGAMAREFAERVRQQMGVDLELVRDTDGGLELLQRGDVVLFGGSHENRLALEAALRYQACVADATVPGPDGWMVATRVGLEASGHNLLQVAAAAGREAEALAYVVEAVDRCDGGIVVRHLHHVVPGTTMQAHFPSWRAFISGMPGGLPQFQGKAVEAPPDPVALADVLSVGLDSGGPEVNLYNVAPVDLAVRSARYYWLSCDRRALTLFRELLFRLADYYLKTPGGASYPSDLDFRLGHLILEYARLEHDPAFSADDRLILSNLLLACTRSIYEYTLTCWPLDPEEPTRHNHETFAALSLCFAADYFARYDVPDVDDWRARASAVFDGAIWRRYKQRENAHHYEQYALEHAASYSAFTGRGLGLFEGDCLRQAARRMMVTTDNFFRPVDYGDTGVSMSPGGGDTLAALASIRHEAPGLEWCVREAFLRDPRFLGFPTGLRRCRRVEAPDAGRWELVPLDPAFIDQFCPGFPRPYAFDKLAFRTGWSERDQYLLLEGVGNSAISHAHNELNGIVRFNHLGRHWVVSNGYGRVAGLANVARSFNTRVLGPEDHNMLVLRREGRVAGSLPVCSALLAHGQAGDLLCATSVVVGYGAVDWFRTLLIASGRFVLVIDRVHVVCDGVESGHVEWNCLGDATGLDSGFRLEQAGVFLDVTSASGWHRELRRADRSADWQRILGTGAYPYATFPLSKPVFRLPATDKGEWVTLATLLAASDSEESPYRVHEPTRGVVVVEAVHGGLTETALESMGLSVRVCPAALEVRLDPEPDLPADVRAWEDARRQG